jgi:predicted RNase H-like nuclease (RuvC/YqgF family)
LKNRFEEENTRLEEEIRGYQERIDGLEGELSGLKTELVGSVSYENWMEEKGKLEKEIKMYK